jgi:hypothetical protein
LVGWLAGPAGDDHRARVVTGQPGSGKSAVLGWLVLLADHTTRAVATARAEVPPMPGDPWLHKPER